MGDLIKYEGTGKLPEIKPGDMVRLKYYDDGGFHFSLDAIINTVKGDLFAATIDKIFNEERTAQITKKGNVMFDRLQDKRVTRSKNYIHPSN